MVKAPFDQRNPEQAGYLNKIILQYKHYVLYTMQLFKATEASVRRLFPAWRLKLRHEQITRPAKDTRR
jgi:hypothetical protein